MPSSLTLVVRHRLTVFLTGQTSLDELKDWLVGALHEAEQQGDASAEDLIYDIMLPMAEESSGYITEDRLRQALHPLVDPVPAPLVS